MNFETTCLPLRPTLYARAMMLTRDRMAADDLVQDVLLKAFLAWDRFSVKESDNYTDKVAAWLNKNLTNQFISMYRTKMRQERILLANSNDIREWGITTLGMYGPNAPNASQYKIRGEVAVKVNAALASISPESRDLVSRIDMRDQSYLQAHQELGIPIGTVKSRLNRARKQLAKALNANP